MPLFLNGIQAASSLEIMMRSCLIIKRKSKSFVLLHKYMLGKETTLTLEEQKDKRHSRYKYKTIWRLYLLDLKPQKAWLYPEKTVDTSFLLEETSKPRHISRRVPASLWFYIKGKMKLKKGLKSSLRKEKPHSSHE